MGYSSFSPSSVARSRESGFIVELIPYPDPVAAETQLPWSVYRALWRIKAWIWRVRKAVELNPNLVQASDVKEILEALTIRLLTGAKLLYDSHEDYFNQFYEYRGRTGIAFLTASFFRCLELLFLPLFHYLFCTDEYLQQLYSRSFSPCPEPRLLRNFAPVDLIAAKESYCEKKELSLVYVGSINRYRGLLEAIAHIDRFNDERDGEYRVTLHVHAAQSPELKELCLNDFVFDEGWLPYEELGKRLRDYDVGISLLQRLKKYERNLPVKNFDYMAAGLSIITSDFGNLKTYVEEADCGYCIDPKDYSAFEMAIMELFSRERRATLGENARRYAEGVANFFEESKEYCDIVIREASRVQGRVK